ncbi:MAG: hypothetical protein EBZ48_09725 [Proteobacteria bacterium]|nr:hypothetical protein [Pseudomonadota bacterium]
MTATVAISLVLAALGFGVVSFIVYSAYRSFIPGQLSGFSARGLAERWRLNHHAKALARVDQTIEHGQLLETVGLLRQALVLDRFSSDRRLIDQSVQLNLATLSRVLAIAELTGAQLENLAVVEDLMQSRGQMQQSYLETLRDQAAFTQRRVSAGKRAPDWAFAEFTRKGAELKDRLDTNKRSLQTQFNQLLQEALRGSSSSVTYH